MSLAKLYLFKFLPGLGNHAELSALHLRFGSLIAKSRPAELTQGGLVREGALLVQSAAIRGSVLEHGHLRASPKLGSLILDLN